MRGGDGEGMGEGIGGRDEGRTAKWGHNQVHIGSHSLHRHTQDAPLSSRLPALPTLHSH